MRGKRAHKQAGIRGVQLVAESDPKVQQRPLGRSQRADELALHAAHRRLHLLPVRAVVVVQAVACSGHPETVSSRAHNDAGLFVWTLPVHSNR